MNSEMFDLLVEDGERIIEEAQACYNMVPAQFHEDKKNGRLPQDGPYTLMHSNGTVYYRCSFKAGNLDGLCEWRREDGRLWKQYSYIDGKLNGSFETWYPNGTREFLHSMRNNRMQGLAEEWYENGEPSIKAEFEDGEKHGEVIEWWDNGHRQLIATYVNGLCHGDFKLFSYQDELIYHVTANSGFPVHTFVYNKRSLKRNFHGNIEGIYLPDRPNLIKDNNQSECNEE